MHTVFISRGSYRRGRELAEKLADRLGCLCLSREELLEQATHHGIPVGKLEEAVMKRRPLTEQMSLLAARYRAYVTTILASASLDGDLVYHGRAGQLALGGVPHILRIRAVTDDEDRYEGVIERLRLSRQKAMTYVEEVDEDVRRWIRTLYDEDVRDPALYNLTVNCSKVEVGNVATALVSLVELPEFQSSPASIRKLRDILLAARCRLALADDPRTRDLSANVRTDGGSVAVTYPPRQAKLAPLIPEVIEGVDGVVELRGTVAASTILWIQERFDPESETLQNVADVAARWDAAVDLIRMLPGEGPSAVTEDEDHAHALAMSHEDGGILEDATRAEAAEDDGGVRETLHRLIQAGVGGSHCVMSGSPQSMVGNVCSVTNVSLAVVDELFLDRSGAVRKRMTRDLASRIADRLRVPVIGAEELKTQYLFGVKQWLQLAASLLGTVLLYLVVFENQETVLRFLRDGGTTHRALAAAAVVVTAPAVAFLWGTAAHHLLRLVRFE